jgi:hypothetical protein
VCDDIDECAESNGSCDPLATGDGCTNSQGGYRCGKCPTGLIHQDTFETVGGEQRLNGSICLLPPPPASDSRLTNINPKMEFMVDRANQATSQGQMLEQIQQQIVDALGLPSSSIRVKAGGGGRRRAQAAMSIAIEVIADDEARLRAFAGIKQQLTDATSPLRASLHASSIGLPAGQDFSVEFECPRGSVMQENRCARCSPEQFAPLVGDTCRPTRGTPRTLDPYPESGSIKFLRGFLLMDLLACV